MTTTIEINEAYRNDSYTSQVIQFYVVEGEGDVTKKIKESFSYIYCSETDEVEFSFIVDEATISSLSIPIYYTINERDIPIVEDSNNLGSDKNLAATVNITEGVSASTVIIRIPALGRLVREVYEDNKSSVGLIIPEDYNPTLGSNFYKDSNDNSYITRDTYEDYLRSSNIEGHILDDVGRKQVQEGGYYKIIKTLRIKCNALEKSIDTDGNYYSADRSVDGYIISGVYTYDLYDYNKNLIRENVIETTPNVTFYNITKDELVIERNPNNNKQKRPALGVLPVPPEEVKSFNYIYVGRLFYEDFDGILQFVQSTNHITLERFLAVDFGETDGTPIYWEGGYPLYIVGPNRGDSISFTVQLEEDDDENYPEMGNFPTNIRSTFSNPEYQRLFNKNITYDPEYGKLTITISAKYTNDEDDPWRPSYAKILPSLEVTNIRIMKTPRLPSYELDIAYYVIQKSSKIGIIPKKYLSKDSTVPIDLERREEDGKYILPVVGGIGVKTAYLGITSEVDPYDKDIVRNWMIRENMNYVDINGEIQTVERSYFFEKYSGAFEEKIMFITGAYDGELPEFYIRDFIDRSDVWRRAIYESEVTIIPVVENTDKTVDLGGGWSYTLDTATNYFIGSHLLYLFNETNKYYTQRFNLIFDTPPNTGPNYSNFKASINGFSILGDHRNEESVRDEDDGLTYTYYDNQRSIYTKLFGSSDTLVNIVDREKSGDEKIEIKYDDSHINTEQMTYQDTDLFIRIVYSADGGYSLSPNPDLHIYHCVTPEPTEFPAFYMEEGNYVRLRTRGGQPLYICVTTTPNGRNDRFGVFREEENVTVYPEVDTLANIQHDLAEDYISFPELSDSAYPAFRIERYPFVDKYKSLVEIKNTSNSRKLIYFGFEDINITDKTVKFDILYPIEKRITTKDIERIPTQSAIRFAFRLIETGANYEYQEIQFYCGLEGIKPLGLLSSSDKRYPEDTPEQQQNSGYPEVVLTQESNKFEVISETYSEIFPDWEVISANNTFEYSAPEGNKIVIIEEEDVPVFEEGNDYLQIDLKDKLGGTDFIDLIRIKEGENSWWNDWRFFIYNKFTNRFSLYCSSGSPELIILDDEDKEVKEITLSRVGLYRLHISDRTGEVGQKRLAILQTNPQINLYTTNITGGDTAYGKTNKNNVLVTDYDKLLSGHTSRGSRIKADEPISVKTYETNTNSSIPSQVIYLWYEGCANGQGTKGRLEFQLTAGSGDGEKTYSKSVSLTQSPGGNITNSDLANTVDEFFDFESYRMTSADPSSPGTASGQFNNRKFSIGDSYYGFPIFNGIPGRITLTNSNSEVFPYKLKLVAKGEENFLTINESYTIDSPNSSSNQTAELPEEGCYILGSFISGTYEIKPTTYGKRGDSIVNQGRRTWELIFTDGSNHSKVSTLYYDSPVDVSKFSLESSGSIGKSSKVIGGSGVDNFLVNAGYSMGTDNIDDSRNDNTFYYDYVPNNNQTLNYPAIPNDRVVIDDTNPISIEFVKKADGTSQTLSNDIDSLSGNILSLSETGGSYKAVEWSNISNNSFNLRFFNDSDTEENCANIPLELLNLFTSTGSNEGAKLSDDEKTIGWVTTTKMKLNLKVLPPMNMDADDYGKMVTNLTDDSAHYPSQSLWYGLGQKFSNQITLLQGRSIIVTNSSDGKGVNPAFIIPMGWFKKQNDHTIVITVSGNHSRGANKLVFGVDVYKKKISDKGSVILGDSISSSTSINGQDITISISSFEVTGDIIVCPKYTNIEYNCFSTVTNSNIKTVGINNGSGLESSNISLGNSLSNIPTTNSTSFYGFKLTSQMNELLGEDGRLAEWGDFSTSLMQTLLGFPVYMTFNIDSGNQANATKELSRAGYQHAIFIQPGYYFRKPYTTASNVGTDAFINWFSFRRPRNSVEGINLVNPQDTAGRSVYILYPNRSADFKIDIGNDRYSSQVTPKNSNPSNGQFFLQEMVIPIYELGFRNGYFTYSGKRTNEEIVINDGYGVDWDVDLYLHHQGDEYCRLLVRKGYSYYPLGVAGGGNGGAQDIDTGGGRNTRAMDNPTTNQGTGVGPSDSTHPGADVVGPYPSEFYTGNNVNTIHISKINGSPFYNIIFKG
jgi:hypothetical protein